MKRSCAGIVLALLAFAEPRTFLRSAAVAAQTTVFSTDFNSGVPIEFAGQTSMWGVQGYSGFGAPQSQFAGQLLRNTATGNPASPTTLTLTGLPPHSSVTIEFLLALMDSWDGTNGTWGPDSFNVSVDGEVVFSSTFSNFNVNEQGYVAPAGGQLMPRPFTNLGFDTAPDAAYDMGVEPAFRNIAHTGSSVQISWFAGGPKYRQESTDESWGIDNVSISLNVDSPPRGPKTHIITMAIDDSHSASGIPAIWGEAANRIANAFSRFAGRGQVIPLARFDDDASNLSDLQSAFATVQGQLQPGDNFVLYVHTHGTFELSGDEPPILSGRYQLNPETGQAEYTEALVQSGDERLVMTRRTGAPDIYLDDDTLTTWLSDSDFDGVNKLVVLDACYSGGFWSNSPTLESEGDLEELEDIAFLAAAPESALGASWYDGLPNTANGTRLWGVLGQALEDVLLTQDATRSVNFSAVVPEAARIAREFLAESSRAERPVFILDDLLDEQWGLPVAANEVNSELVYSESEGFSFVLGVPEPTSMSMALLLAGLSFTCRRCYYWSA